MEENSRFGKCIRVLQWALEKWQNCHQWPKVQTTMQMLQPMDPKAWLFYFKPQHMPQIHQIRINTMLRDCYQVVKLLSEFLNTEDHSHCSAETYTKNMLGELRESWNTINNYLLLWHFWKCNLCWPFKHTRTTKECAFLLI